MATKNHLYGCEMSGLMGAPTKRPQHYMVFMNSLLVDQGNATSSEHTYDICFTEDSAPDVSQQADGH